MLASVITNFECGNSGHLCSYDIYALTVNDMYMESSVNEGMYLGINRDSFRIKH
jgi:hypothetical protein